ncbi:MAG: NYN domain-containing protein [Planctomycetes bacterium]|jgi:hypothetical protein|nr:NYN domain-containing protein [Planctomycetota bacterium]MCP4839361.1 NYN domain-containing protein [Planctomycetota bacterium]
MRVLIDAWNVLHQEGVLPPGLAGIDLEGLGRLMQATRWQRVHATLACDGIPKPRPEDLPGAIHVIWSGAGREADDVIEGLIRRSTTPRRLIVVSSDRRLQKAARRRRCKWLSSEDFLRTILEDLASGVEATPLPSGPPESAEAWVGHFGLSKDEIAAIEAETEAADLDSLIPGQETSSQRPPEPGHSQPSPADSAASQPTGEHAKFPESVLEQARRIAGGQ